MSDDSMDNFVRDAVTRMKQLHERAGAPPTHQRGLLPETFEELQISLEELDVASEELRQQNEELINKRHQLELERNRYQELFNFAPDALVVTDLHGSATESNRAASAVLGISQQFLRGKPLVNFVSDADKNRFRDHLFKLQSALEGMAVISVEIQPRQGRPFPGEVTAGLMKTPAGVVNSIRWMIRDITVQRQAQSKREEVLKLQTEREAIEHTYSRMSHVLEDITDPFFMLDSEWRLTFVNRQCEKSWDKDRAFLAGKSIWPAFPGLISSHFAEQMQIGMQERRSVQVETLSPINDRWIQANIHPTDFGIAVYFRDVDDGKKEQDRLHGQQEHDHVAAQVLQESLMIRPGQTQIVGLEIASFYAVEMREAMGGEFCDVIALPGGRAALILGDVTGKGLNAATLTAQLKYALRVFLWEQAEPSSVLKSLNRFIVSNLAQFGTKDEKLVKLTIAIVDPKSGEIQIGSAGGEPVLILRSVGQELEIAQAQGMIVGVDENYEYQTCRTTLNPGDSIMMVTDGLTEARSGKAFLGLNGISDIISTISVEDSVANLCQAIVTQAQVFAGGAFSDDACILICRRSRL